MDRASSDGMREPKRTVYVLKSQHEPPHFYVGVTAAAQERLADHNAGRCPHTVRYRPWRLHVTIEFAAEQTALRFDRYLKSGSGRAFAQRHFES
jgi:predicted GIY-YIG superfamily endonuclease